MTGKEKQPSFLGDEGGGASKVKGVRAKRNTKGSKGENEPRVTTEAERVPTTGRPMRAGGGVPSEVEEEPEGKDGGREPTNEARTKRPSAAGGTSIDRKRKGGGSDRAGKTGRAEPVYVRLSGAMLEAVEEAVKGSPIEFADRSEFIRRAVENELRRRGLVSTYK